MFLFIYPKKKKEIERFYLVFVLINPLKIGDFVKTFFASFYMISLHVFLLLLFFLSFFIYFSFPLKTTNGWDY